MTARRGAIALAIVCLCAGPAAAKTFTDSFVGPTQALGHALSQTVARSLPVTSASPGLTFSYDPASGAFVRDTDLLGQLYLERARPTPSARSITRAVSCPISPAGPSSSGKRRHPARRRSSCRSPRR